MNTCFEIIERHLKMNRYQGLWNNISGCGCFNRALGETCHRRFMHQCSPGYPQDDGSIGPKEAGEGGKSRKTVNGIQEINTRMRLEVTTMEEFKTRLIEHFANCGVTLTVNRIETLALRKHAYAFAKNSKPEDPEASVCYSFFIAGKCYLHKKVPREWIRGS